MLQQHFKICLKGEVSQNIQTPTMKGIGKEFHVDRA